MAFFQTQKALTIKETDKSDFIKIKNFFYLKMPLRHQKANHIGRLYLQNIFLIKGLYPI